jgi:hypothetical protein
MRRPGQQAAGGPRLGDPAEVEHGRLLAQLTRDGQVVRDEEVSQFPFGAQAAHELEDPGLRGDVERAGRLVQDEQPGGDRERPGDGRSLPVAILLLGILHFIQDDEGPYQIVDALMDAVPAGSYLAISHLASDLYPEQIVAFAHRRRASEPGHHSARHRRGVPFFQPS